MTQTKTVPAQTPIGARWQMSETFDILFARGRDEMEKAIENLSEVYEEGLKKGDYYAAGVALIRLRYIRRYGLGLPSYEGDVKVLDNGEKEPRDYSRWYLREYQKEPRWDWRYY